MRVALYCRVSTEEQAVHGLSIEAQKAALSEWAANHYIVDYYIDLGVSARKSILKRPELQRLLKDVEQDKIDVVAFTKLDRWTRNIREYYRAEDILEAHHVAWRAIHEDYETETAAGRLKVNIMLAVAQDEADRASERIKAVFSEKKKKGLAVTGSVPIGIKIENGVYVPSDEAQTVRDIFETYISTRSARETASRSCRTSQGVRYALTNRLYLDLGIIDPATWERAQEVLKTRSQRMTKTERVYLFSGLINCPNCGAKMTGLLSRNYYYYRCSRHISKKDCSGKVVSENKLERYLLDNTIRAVEEVNVRISDKRKAPDLLKLKAKLDKLTDLYMNDLITRDKYEVEYRAVQAQIADAERQPTAVNVDEIRTLLGAYDGLSRLGKKAFWSHLIRSITPTENAFDVEFYT